MNSSTKPWIATLYFYLIAAICIVTIIFAGINGLMGLYTIVDPESKILGYEWQNYADFEEFKRMDLGRDNTQPRQVKEGETDVKSIQKELSEEEWQKRWQNYRRITVEGIAKGGKRDLVNMLIVIIVCLPLFLIHWRFARKSGGSAESITDNSVDKGAPVA